MKKQIRFLTAVCTAALLLFGSFSAAALASPADLYVDARSGSDDNPGTRELPLRSVRKAKQALGTNGGTLHFADGEYFIDSTVTHTGTSAAVVYRADGSHVVFTGAQKITDWQDDRCAGRDCWSVTPASMPEQVRLYDKTAPLQNARMPDEGNFYLVSGDEPHSDDATFARNTAVTTRTADTKALAECDLAGNRCFIRILHYWTEELLLISSYNEKSGQIHFKNNARCTNTANKNDPYYFENVLCGFDSPGEWYADYAAGKVYYLPRAGETKENAEIYLAVTEQLFRIDGADNIRFEGITFRNTNWIYTDTYSQSAYGSKTAVLVTNASHVGFDRCRFCNIGASALNFGNWGNGNTRETAYASVTGCLFRNIGASAVVVGGSKAENAVAFVPHDIVISDNLMQDYGQTRRQATALFITNAYNMTVSGNEIHDGLYTGISVGWTWGYDSTPNHDNRITDNLIYHIGHGSLSDMGGIYVLGRQPGSVIRGNVIFDVCTGADCTTYGGWGIYTDEGSLGWTIEDNLVYDCGSQGFHQHYGQQNLVRHNIFAFNEEGQVRSSACHVACSEADDISGQSKLYTDKKDGSQFLLTENILLGSSQFMYQNLNKNYFTDDGNLYWDCKRGAAVRSEKSNGTKLLKSSVQLFYGSNDYNNGQFADPRFVDADERNFRLEADSPVPELLHMDEIDLSGVGAASFGSVYLLNRLPAGKEYYDPVLWQNWENARKDAKRERTEETVTALREAYEALADSRTDTPDFPSPDKPLTPAGLYERLVSVLLSVFVNLLLSIGNAC